MVQLSYSLYPNLVPQLERNLYVPSNFAPQLVQNLSLLVNVDVNDDVEADDVAPSTIACPANAKARSSRDDCSTNPHI